MAGSAEMLAAFRELTQAKQLERNELLALLTDGIQAALARKFGAGVKFELTVDELQGILRVVRLRHVVEEVEDPSWQVPVEEAQFIDPDFAVGDVLEEDVPFHEFGRLAVQAAKQRIIQRVREGERTKIRDEFGDKVGELLSGEIQQIERGKLVLMLAKFREAEAIIPYREQNHREHFHQGDTIRAVLKRLEETPKGPRLILSRADPGFVAALFRLEVPEIAQDIVEIRGIAREVDGSVASSYGFLINQFHVRHPSPHKKKQKNKNKTNQKSLYFFWVAWYAAIPGMAATLAYHSLRAGVASLISTVPNGTAWLM